MVKCATDNQMKSCIIGETHRTTISGSSFQKKGGRTPMTIFHLDILWGADERGHRK